jgi:hypothetical protein
MQPRLWHPAGTGDPLVAKFERINQQFPSGPARVQALLGINEIFADEVIIDRHLRRHVVIQAARHLAVQQKIVIHKTLHLAVPFRSRPRAGTAGH